MKKQTTKIVAFLFLIIVSLSFVSSLTGSMGNARMILRMEQGEEIEKYILVKNVNNISIEIELSPNGDLADYIKISEDNFELAPNTEKKAYFTIKAKKEGTTESKIDVKFSPVGGGNGVGLSSTIIVIASEGDSWWNSDDDDNDVDNNSSDSPNSVNVISGKAISGVKSMFRDINWIIALPIILILIFFILVGVLLSMLRKRKGIENVRNSNKPKKRDQESD